MWAGFACCTPQPLERTAVELYDKIYRTFGPYRSQSLDGARCRKCNFRLLKQHFYSADENVISAARAVQRLTFFIGKMYGMVKRDPT
eukprot:COSAG02_NODE_20688_length_819_cov_1.165278_2_plen_87_part_00